MFYSRTKNLNSIDASSYGVFGTLFAAILGFDLLGMRN